LIAGVPLGPCVVREAVKAGDLAEVKRLVEELEAEDRPIVHPKTMDAAVFSTQANRHAMVDYLKSKGFPAEFDLG
jgi:hypothetical protein